MDRVAGAGGETMGSSEVAERLIEAWHKYGPLFDEPEPECPDPPEDDE